MKLIFNGILVGFVLATPVQAQGTRQTTGVATPQNSGPFGSDWARPFPQTGGYVYDDPRRGGSNSRIVVCPRGSRLSAYSGRCYRG